MSLTFDFSSHQAFLSNLEAVTYTSVRAAGNQSVSVTDAGFYPQSRVEGSPSFGVYAKWMTKFSIRVAALASVGGANLRDTITRANGDVYTVLRMNPGNITQTWQLDAVNLVLAANLSATGTLQRPTNAQDSTGKKSLTTYNPIATAIPCRVQPLDSQTEDVFGRKTIRYKFAAFLAQQVSAQAQDQFVSGGVTYTVTGFTNPQRIDELPTLTLESIL